ncbi:hypothetical protein LCGC14_3010500 [marine sediment metagenome]|uniref:Uncharacterized protein n=1 Tax=marine sediment metagenome TaxID=412755 RepID=A0A0F8WY80_9ZZZZ
MPKNIKPKNHMKISVDDMRIMNNALITLTEQFPISPSSICEGYWKLNSKSQYNAALKAFRVCADYLNPQ